MTDVLFFAADPGEANRVTIGRDGERLIFEDRGAAIVAGRGCHSLAANRVSCAPPQVPLVAVELEDGGDSATTSGDAATGVLEIYLAAGAGDDTLRGTADRTSLDGGPGHDVLSGGPGTFDIRATIRLSRFAPVSAPNPLVPERDEVSCAPSRNDSRTDATVDGEDVVSGDCRQTMARAAAAPAASHPARRSSARARRCSRASHSEGADVVARTRRAVIFTKRGFHYGCLRSVGRIRRLPSEGGGIHAVKLAGRFAAYATFGSAIGDEFDRVYVYDLRRGFVKRATSLNTRVRVFVLKHNGSAAWIQAAIVSGGSKPLFEVRKLGGDELYGDVLLDRAADPRSLALSRDRRALHWTSGGGAHSAPLR